MRRFAVLLPAFALTLTPQQQPVPQPQTLATTASWKAVYLHDEDDSALRLGDLAWPGERCAIAVGILQTRGRKPQPAVLRSLDGGQTWSIQTNSKSFFRSVFFLSDRLGWAVTEDGIVRTPDCGATWEPLSREKNVVRVYFTDEANGVAVGAPKRVWSTKDGGRALNEIKPELDPKADPKRSLYTWIDFVGEQLGVIVGFHEPQRSRRNTPAWLDPEIAQLDRQLPALTLMLQTVDGGKTWRGSSVSLMGRVTRIRMAPQNRTLLLVEFEDTFEWPSEVYRVATGSQEMDRVFREKNRAITDLIHAGNWSYVGGIEPVGGAIRMPVPGKVKILRSADFKIWEEMSVDYRAVATRLIFARGPGFRAMAATDNGTILLPR